jgi:hypothetical protein
MQTFLCNKNISCYPSKPANQTMLSQTKRHVHPQGATITPLDAL